MDAGALKHIFIWIVLISLFFLLLFGVHLLFFPSVEPKAIKDTSLVQHGITNKAMAVFKRLSVTPCSVHFDNKGDT